MANGEFLGKLKDLIKEYPDGVKISEKEIQIKGRNCRLYIKPTSLLITSLTNPPKLHKFTEPLDFDELKASLKNGG
ncbi:MAG: hypothetical protein AAB656_04255 [Patescibacteria group bacterium]